MKGFMNNEKPKVGIFWYNYADNTLFGVEKGDAELYTDQGNIITYPKLHKTYWQKQHHRAVAKNEENSIFYKEHNYTLIPRGRIFLEGDVFYVNVGSWINGEVNELNCIDKDKLRELILDEFNLPDDFIFRVDHHWDIGHGWSEERFQANSYIITINKIWDYYILNYEDDEFTNLTVYYHTWEENGNVYTAEFITECSSRHVYAKGYYTKNGKETTLKAIKNSLNRLKVKD